MNNLVERYIYDVVRRLPESVRPEVERELRANLADMLGGDESEDAVKTALISLGPPAKLAEQYRPRPRYLISPAMFDTYFTVLKIVLFAAGAVTMAFGLLDALTVTPAAGTGSNLFAEIGRSIADILAGTLSALLSAFAYVTIIFALVERIGGAPSQEAWTPDGLPAVPQPTKGISRVETSVGLVFGLFFSILFLRYSSLIAFYTPSGATPLFNGAVLARFAPAILVLLGLTLASAVLKLVFGRWNWGLALFNAVHNLIFAFFAVAFFRWPDLVNPAFFRTASETLGNEEFVSLLRRYGGGALLGLILVAVGFDIVSGFYHAYKTASPGKQFPSA